MSKAGASFPMDSKNPEIIAKRVTRDLLWILVSLAAALAAASAAYTLLPM